MVDTAASTPAEAQVRMTPGSVWPRIHSRILLCMQSTSVRIDTATHDELKRLAAELGTTVGNTVSLAVRSLRQDQIGSQLQAELTSAEVDWLNADIG